MEVSEVSRTKRLAQAGSSVIFCFFLVGIVFGFAALKPILVDSGVYSEYCNGQERCKKQDTKLNQLFIIASSVNNIGALPMGTYLDRVGPRAATLTGAVLCMTGSILFSLGIVKPYFDSYIAGFALLGLCSPAIFLAQFHLSNTFPSRSGLILGSITGAFDASSLSICLYKVAYFRFGGKTSLRVFFLCYAVIPGLLIIQQLTFGPAVAYERPNSKVGDDSLPDQPVRPTLPPPSGSARDRKFPARPPRRRASSSFSRISYDVHDAANDEDVKNILGKDGEADPIVGALFGLGAGKQVLSKWWLAMEFMVIVHMTRINWYLTTVGSQLVYYTGDEGLADKLNDAFIFLLPLAGLVSIPAIGYLLDTRPLIVTVLVMTVMGVLFGGLTLLHGPVPQLIGLGILVVFRPLFYTAMSDYGAKVFGFQTFGTVYGLGMTLSGVFGFVLTPLDLLTKGPLNGSYTPVNLTLLILGLISGLTMAYVIWSHSRQGRIILSDSSVVNRHTAIQEEDEDGS
ncbi:major facilitator superfamily domain-containing protein [Kockovaella imperatae]|uniref:Major facilitator superfamily domain-containing protein n=1 Tax=Kockovaella imperatae TaxID=4999 RepID=A0A1Y1UFU2_9TREE|nr:major facilitator superfamily domain-containing protein [Kockovaella imperatae]ORX36384.1 major facilitator superfamily domain-containing protein [Kockovaella imperatae]